jgi:hypothetical protein
VTYLVLVLLCAQKVVVGLLNERYPNDPSIDIGLFDLGEYGVPIAMAGICYILLASPVLLPGGKGRKDGERGSIPMDNQEDVLLGARLAPWSPAAGRSVKRSGLRDTGGIYLVSVHRATTGNVHRAVGQDFVLNVGDILYFTGLVEGFGEFCEENGLEILTNENDNAQKQPLEANTGDGNINPSSSEQLQQIQENTPSLMEEPPTQPLEANFQTIGTNHLALSVVLEGSHQDESDEIPCEVGVTKESLIRADEAERSRSITRMTDLIRGQAPAELTTREDNLFGRRRQGQQAEDSIVVTSDHEYVVVGVNAVDRAGLLLDVSKGLLSLKLSLRHTEASVVGPRSISIWRCELVDSDLPDLEEIWSVLNVSCADLLWDDLGLLKSHTMSSVL